MYFFPKLSLTFFNGFLFIIPMFILRFFLPYVINPNSLPKLQYFPEVIGIEKIALKIYFITNTYLIFSPLIHPIILNSKAFNIGVYIYIIGMFFFLFSIIYFSKDDNFTQIGIYKISRNPMYIGYFFIFIGTSLFINSLFNLLITIIYQMSVHFLILSEERWCIERFGQKYIHYLNKVPRYFLLF